MSSLDLLAPNLTPEIRNMAMGRLLGGRALIGEKDKLTPEQKSERKLALLVVHAINPHEDLSEAEEALIRGMNVKTLRDAKLSRSILPIS